MIKEDGKQIKNANMVPTDLNPCKADPLKLSYSLATVLGLSCQNEVKIINPGPYQSVFKPT